MPERKPRHNRDKRACYGSRLIMAEANDASAFFGRRNDIYRRHPPTVSRRL